METGGTTTMDYATMFGGLKTEILNGITSVTPIALTVLGTILAIGVAVKVFKKLAK